AHDGFTIEDLVSYEQKHNLANGEDNRDGHEPNYSTNAGVEGPSDDPEVLGRRERLKRSLIASLFLSQGIPMLLGGDELSRTQQGNNNTYCQDNELNWYNWELDERQEEFLAFVQQVIHFRRKHQSFRRHHFLTGRPNEKGIKDAIWWHHDGHEMRDEDWARGDLRAFGLLLPGGAIRGMSANGHPLEDATFLILFNSRDETTEFGLPNAATGEGVLGWEAEETFAAEDAERFFPCETKVQVEKRGLLVLRRVDKDDSK
ncbi:MAG: glycogen debranching enzyme GlgX, partial [Catalinimonas sp.]